VLTGGAGARALSRAFEHVFGTRHALDDLPMAGRTDPWIVEQMAASCGLICDAAALQRVHDLYLEHLATEIHLPGPRKGVMPGVRPLLDALAVRDEVYLALLTGNFEGGARLKLEYFDLWRYFRCGAFGSDAPDRNALLATAIGRAHATGAPRFMPSDIVIVGDTPHDVGVALAGGARAVAVATGSYDRDTLRASGADVVLDDLDDLGAVLDALELDP
jgi:phosphoglycolate phosphatase-like HAD superfamily hydrolase